MFVLNEMVAMVTYTYYYHYSGSNEGTVLSVLAADVNEESLKINVNTAVQDNLCDQSGYEYVQTNKQIDR